MTTVVRTWKRNGDENWMFLEDAVKNLGENAIGHPQTTSVADKRADALSRLMAGQTVETPLASFRLAAVLLALLLSALPAVAQVPEWYWTKLDETEYALWHRGVQAGAYRLSDESYYPRLAPGQWGDACNCPCVLPPAIETALSHYRKTHWQTRGVLTGSTKDAKRNGGLHYRNLPAKPPAKPDCGCPKCKPGCDCGCQPPLTDVLSDGLDKIPDYSAMPSLTFVAKNEADARAALKRFLEAPELAHWRAKYGPRAKAYSLEEFQHVSSAFKLAQDRRFQETGFAALIQPQAPDEQGRAEVKSCYSWATPEQALRALRDADPAYDPNAAPVLPATPAVPAATESAALWGKVAASVGLGGSSLLMVLGAIAAALKSILN